MGCGWVACFLGGVLEEYFCLELEGLVIEGVEAEDLFEGNLGSLEISAKEVALGEAEIHLDALLGWVGFCLRTWIRVCLEY